MNTQFVIVGKPRLERNSSHAILSSLITFPDLSVKEMYFKYPCKFFNYVNYEGIDGFLLSLLPYCIRNNIGIKSDYCASEYLLWNLKEILIPVLSDNIQTHHKIRLDIKPSSIHFNGAYAGTGLSCGVDSFYTILKNNEVHVDSSMKIKYLCYFNAGASGCGEEGIKKYNERKIMFERVASELKCDFLTGETNINELYPDILHEQTHVYRTLGMVLNLQKLFKVYYFSSGFKYPDFKFDDLDPAYHDILSMQVLSTLSTRFVLVGAETSRFDKIKYISNYQIATNNLNVCIPNVTNCGLCIKCVRTLLEIFLIGKLDNYSNSFDINFFKNNFKFYVREALFYKNATDMNPIVSELKRRRLITFKDRIVVFIAKTKLKKFVRVLAHKK